MQIVAGLWLNEAALWLRRVRLPATGPEVLVVEMHETLQQDADRFRRQLEWVAEHFTFISPESFFRLWTEPHAQETRSKSAVLFTFDDGRESNYTVAAPLLEAMGTRGLFFVVPDFIGLRGHEAKDFYYSKIDIRGLPQVDSEEVWTPMTPEQLADLAQRGHSVGSHTLSHNRLAGLSPSDLRTQIVTSSERIAFWTQRNVDAFAWPYAWNAITREAWDLVRETHRFCFSPCPGTVRCVADSPHLIWRTEVEAYYSDPEYRFMYSGWIRPIWARRRRGLKAILKG